MRSLSEPVMLGVVLAVTLSCQPDQGSDPPSGSPRVQFEVEASERVTPQGDLEAFVYREHFHGVPYGEARRYTVEQVPQLLAVLADTTKRPFWSNVAVTTGMIGDATASEALISFVEFGPARVLTPEEYTARTSAIISLGYLANHGDERVALGYLLASLRPGAWSRRDLAWQSPFSPSADARDVELVKVTMIGLALSGAPRALRALTGLRDDDALRDSLGIDETYGASVVSEHETITRLGLSAYYDPSRP